MAGRNSSPPTIRERLGDPLTEQSASSIRDGPGAGFCRIADVFLQHHLEAFDDGARMTLHLAQPCDLPGT
ncbi:MAG: hypothetical protein GY925_04560 [Actinomycetia bacterium]|nr:hypothetical protein [Actinomycetes bacterium]